MYRGFNVKLGFPICRYFVRYYAKGLDDAKQQKKIIKNKINSFIGENGILNGSMMQANWFPQIKADIFISHSHKDKELALALAGWLKVTFGLTAFIDSCVWGYANDLLKMIDNEYCYQEETNTYSYQKRNYSTGHVHMMLSVALTQMIDNTECLFFLNTPNSITPDTIINQTESPWIYSEIAMTRLIRKKERDEYRLNKLQESQKTFSFEEFIVQYDVPIDHLTDIGVMDLITWKKKWKPVIKHERYRQYSNDFKVHALDKLYEKTNK